MAAAASAAESDKPHCYPATLSRRWGKTLRFQGVCGRTITPGMGRVAAADGHPARICDPPAEDSVAVRNGAGTAEGTDWRFHESLPEQRSATNNCGISYHVLSTVRIAIIGRSAQSHTSCAFCVVYLFRFRSTARAAVWVFVRALSRVSGGPTNGDLQSDTKDQTQSRGTSITFVQTCCPAERVESNLEHPVAGPRCSWPAGCDHCFIELVGPRRDLWEADASRTTRKKISIANLFHPRFNITGLDSCF